MSLLLMPGTLHGITSAVYVLARAIGGCGGLL
jgi:hypothetical protein